MNSAVDEYRRGQDTDCGKINYVEKICAIVKKEIDKCSLKTVSNNYMFRNR